MRINKLKTTALLASAAFLMTAVNIAHAHGGGSTHYVKHQQPVHTTYHEQYRLYPKKHYHPATAYVPATYHAHVYGLLHYCKCMFSLMTVGLLSYMRPVNKASCCLWP